MKYCKKCFQPDTQPHGEFTEDGICFACKYSEMAEEEIDWVSRIEELKGIAQWAKENSRGGWDCAIGVSGGKDSTFQALYAKNELGLNCLLVNCVPEGITEMGIKNIENLSQHGFDMVRWRPNPKVMRALTRRAFYEYGNPVKPSEYPLWAVTFQTAFAYKIPLIIQGENPGLTLGSTKGTGKGGEAYSIFNNNTLSGGNASDWTGEGISEKDLILYQAPDVEEMKKAGIKALYLQYYVKEWSPRHNTEFSKRHGLTPRPDKPWYFNRYGSVDSNFQLFNPMIKYYKFGFASPTVPINHLIREGKMTREIGGEGWNLIKKYDGFCEPEVIEECCNYMEITVEEFWRVMEEKWINKKLFRKNEEGKWVPKFTPGIDFNEDGEE